MIEIFADFRIAFPIFNQFNDEIRLSSFFSFMNLFQKCISRGL